MSMALKMHNASDAETEIFKEELPLQRVAIYRVETLCVPKADKASPSLDTRFQSAFKNGFFICTPRMV